MKSIGQVSKSGNRQSAGKVSANGDLQQQNGNRDTPEFVDNRPGTAAQKQLIETIKNSPQAKKIAQTKAMIHNSPRQTGRKEIPATNLTSTNVHPGFKGVLQKFGNRKRLDHEPFSPSKLPTSQYQYGNPLIRGPYRVPSKVIAYLGTTGFGPNVQNTPFSADVKSLRPYTYESAHMLARSHGGTLGPGNIVPLLESTNKDMLDNVETKLYAARYKGEAARVFKVEVTPQYGEHTGVNLDPIEQYTPTKIDYSIEEYEFKGKKWTWDNWKNWQNQGDATTLGYKKTITHNPSFNFLPNKSGHTLQEKATRVNLIVNEAISKAKKKSESEVDDYLKGIEKIKWYYLNKLKPASPKVFDNQLEAWDKDQKQVFVNLISDLKEFLSTGELSEILEEYEIKKTVPGY